MSLTDEDIDRVELAVMRGFERHEEKRHEPQDKRIRSLENERWYHRGAFAALGGVSAYLGWLK